MSVDGGGAIRESSSFRPMCLVIMDVLSVKQVIGEGRYMGVFITHIWRCLTVGLQK